MEIITKGAITCSADAERYSTAAMTPTALSSGDCICVGYKPLACLGGLSRPRLVTCVSKMEGNNPDHLTGKVVDCDSTRRML
jgi:hypothetical protein